MINVTEHFLAQVIHIYLETVSETVLIEFHGYSTSHCNRTPTKFCKRISLKEALDKKITKSDYFKGCQIWKNGQLYSNHTEVYFDKKYTQKDFEKMVL